MLVGEDIGVLGGVAQQEGEGILRGRVGEFWLLECELPEVAQLMRCGRWNRRVTGLDKDTDREFETEITRGTNPFRAP